jgi:hypothetical protein
VLEVCIPRMFLHQIQSRGLDVRNFCANFLYHSAVLVHRLSCSQTAEKLNMSRSAVFANKDP